MTKKLKLSNSIKEKKNILTCNTLSNDMIFKKYHISINQYIELINEQYICLIENGKLLDIKSGKGIYYIEEINENSKYNVLIPKVQKNELSAIFMNGTIIKNNRCIFNNFKYDKFDLEIEVMYDLKITNPEKFLGKIIELRTHYSKQELIEILRKYLFSYIKACIKQCKSESEIINHIKAIEEEIYVSEWNLKITERGVALTNFRIMSFKIVERKNIFF